MEKIKKFWHSPSNRVGLIILGSIPIYWGINTQWKFFQNLNVLEIVCLCGIFAIGMYAIIFGKDSKTS